MNDYTQYAIESDWYKHEEAARRLLVVYAHPDDESFGNAGTLARYAAEGVAVHYACGTRGECGTVDPAFLESHPDIATLRCSELDCAARVLGLTAVHQLGYRDSNMPGTPDNDHPDSLWQAPPERVAGQIAALIRGIRPQVVLTFNTYGGYGHPDHIKIHRAAMAAFHAAGNATLFPEQIAAGLQPWSPTKLYYSTFGTAMLRVLIMGMRLVGKDPSKGGTNGDIDFRRAVEEMTPVTTVVDSSAFLEQKGRAVSCHASQLHGRERYTQLPGRLRRLLDRPEHFTRIIPEWNGQERREQDLFEGIAF